MKTHDLIQGSPAWLAYRAKMRNASDAPAMLGCSPYKSRAELLREMHTGVAAEVDIGTQKRFDNGHRAEALARPLAEDIIGSDLYPVTGSLGNLSASFDGLTLDETEGFEHKALNNDIRAAFDRMWAERADGTRPGLMLPIYHRVQMEQQLHVSAAERILFMASEWTADGQLVEERHCWYYPDDELRGQILAGWAQFDRDLAAYTLQPAAEPVQAEPMESLPAVSVRLDGALSVAGNLPTFAEALKAFIAKMPTRPATDTEFATCEAACKSLKKAEEALDAAEAGALASITDVEAMRRAVADCRKLARDTRLAAEKMVERRKLELKESAVMRARQALDMHVAAVNAEIAPMRLQPIAVDFAGAIKGKRSIDSMQDALDTTLATAKIAADAQGRAIRANVAVFKADAAGYEFLFADLGQIVHKGADDFALAVQHRIHTHKAAEAAKEAKRQADEAARIAAAEQRARDEVIRKAEADMRAAEAEAARIHTANAAAEQQRIRDAGDAAIAATKAISEAQAATSAIGGAMGLPPSLSAGANRQTPKPEPATLNLGAINARFGGRIKLDAAGLLLMGIAPSDTAGAAKLYRESDIGRICRALVVLAGEVVEMAEEA